MNVKICENKSVRPADHGSERSVLIRRAVKPILIQMTVIDLCEHGLPNIRRGEAVRKKQNEKAAAVFPSDILGVIQNMKQNMIHQTVFLRKRVSIRHSAVIQEQFDGLQLLLCRDRKSVV